MTCFPRPFLLSSLLAAALLAGAAQATLPTSPVLTLDAARAIIRAAETKARTEGWPCVIAVVDADGLVILLERSGAGRR
jgi:glc operon protein GlcG